MFFWFVWLSVEKKFLTQVKFRGVQRIMTITRVCVVPDKTREETSRIYHPSDANPRCARVGKRVVMGTPFIGFVHVFPF